MKFLATHCAIDVFAFAVMINHVHLLLRIRPQLVQSWSDREIATRRIALLPSRRRRKSLGNLSESVAHELEIALIMRNPALLAKTRRDLSDLGFFHRLFKEPSARMWNREDEVKGHFWEGRFKSPRVLDQQALLRVSNYIELNEIHAGGAHSLDGSRWTSVKLQLQKLTSAVRELCLDEQSTFESKIRRLDSIEWEPVFASRTVATSGEAGALSIPDSDDPIEGMPALIHYIDRVDQLGRTARPDKPGSIASIQPSAVSAAIDLAAASLSRSSAAAREAVKRIHDWWRDKIRSELNRLAWAPPTLAPLPWMFSGRGSCYGDRGAVACEAQRRNCKWLIPILGDA